MVVRESVGTQHDTDFGPPARVCARTYGKACAGKQHIMNLGSTANTNVHERTSAVTRSCVSTVSELEDVKECVGKQHIMHLGSCVDNQRITKLTASARGKTTALGSVSELTKSKCVDRDKTCLSALRVSSCSRIAHWGTRTRRNTLPS